MLRLESFAAWSLTVRRSRLHAAPGFPLARVLVTRVLASLLLAALGLATLGLATSGRAAAQEVPCTGICAEAENFVPPTGSALMGSGPNASGIVNFDIKDPTIRSGGKNIWNYTFYDWLEWEVDIPSDGLYTITYRYASGFPDNEKYQVAFTFWTSGQQVITNGAPMNSSTYQDPGLFTFPDQVPLKIGRNRFRAQIRPDMGLVGTGGSYNLDYIKFNRVGEYPGLVAVTGTVTVNVNGAPTPIEGALVSEDPDPAKGALYTEASHLARTDATGKYTLYLSPGAHQVTAFLNGYQKVTAPVTAPATKDFTLTYSGKFEAELLDATNPGTSDRSGVLPAYATVVKDVNGAETGKPSGNGLVANTGTVQGKFASYRHIYVPQAGVYDVSMHYASQFGTTPTASLNWSANGGPSAALPYNDTGDFGVYADSGKTLIALNAGQNTLRWTNPNRTNFANVDTFTLTPTTQPYGTLNITVKDTSGKALPGAKVTIAGPDANYLGNTDGNGNLTLPVQPTSATPYTITVEKAGASATDTASVANGANVTVPFTLTVTAISVEAEDVLASGPDVPGPSVQVVSMAGASGGKVLEGLAGTTPDPGEDAANYHWAEWTVTVPSDGLYEFAMQYATLYPPSEFTLWFESTSAMLHYIGLPPTGGPTEYTEFKTSDFEQIPLKAGPNRFRIIAGSGGLNIDYFYVRQVGSMPAMGTVTGKVMASDGTGTAPVRNAVVYGNDADGNLFVAFTDATGAYTLQARTGTATLQATVAGYNASSPTNVNVSATPATKDITLQPNNPASSSPPTLRIGFPNSPDIWQAYSAVAGIGPGSLSTAVQEISYVAPSPDTWVDLNVNAARSGMYAVSIKYSSDWPPADQPGHLTLTANGQTATGTFPKTGSWANYTDLPNIASVPLQAGPNTVRLAFPSEAANITYLDFVRTGDIVLPPSTDLNSSGKTDIVDAVLYARRLQSLDPGPTPDLTGDGKSDANDVRRILAVAGGLL